MKYLIERPFTTVLGGSFRMKGVRGDPEATTDGATVGEVLYWLLESYSPQSLQHPLNLGELRRLNRLIECFGEPAEFYAVEDSDFELLLRVAPQMAIVASPRNAPLVEDAIREASKEKPREG